MTRRNTRGIGERLRLRGDRFVLDLEAKGRLGEPPPPLRLATAVAVLVALLGILTWGIGRSGAWTPSLILAAIAVVAIAFAVGGAVLAWQQRVVGALDDARAELAAMHVELETLQRDLETAGHDVKRTAAALGAAVHALERDGMSPEILGAISGQIEALRQLLRPHMVDLQPVPLSALAPPLESFAALHGVHLQVELPGDVVAELDPAKTSQILQNLIDNARKYAPGSPIGIRTELEGPVAKILVEDDGPGIGGDPEGLFLPGVRDPSAAQGFGMGLATSRRLAEAMGGALWYEGAGDRGARFVLKVQRHEEPR